MTWTVHFDDDYNRRSLKQMHDTKEDAFKAACALRQRCSNIWIEGPSYTERYYEEEIAAWCGSHP